MRVVYGSHDIKLSTPERHAEVMATYTETGTNCPITCHFHPDNDSAYRCYTMKGRPRLHSLNNNGIEIGKLSASIENMLHDRQQGKRYATKIRICRMHVAGDIIDPTTQRPHIEYVKELVSVCMTLELHGIDILGYTHAWRYDEAQPLKRYFMASCDSWQEVAQARELQWITTTTKTDQPAPPDIKAVQCPNQITNGSIKCIDCMLCSPMLLKPDTRRTIVFTYH